MTYDLVVRDGIVVDGTGQPGYRADVGIRDQRIVTIGRIREPGYQEIDAEGHVVTPGFIDGHTHMDAQINWDPLGTCACWHGVTTVVMGNCGFTLAPVRKDQRALVVRNLERAEDISPAAMAAGIDWRWETFPEYLNVLDALPKGINYAANIGHSALRTWAMGARAFEEEAADSDLAVMQKELRDALKAGAVGLTTSLSSFHQTSDDKPVASRLASWDEVCQLVGVLAEIRAGIFEIAQESAVMSPDPAQRAEANARLESLAVESGVPITYGVMPGATSRETWQEQLTLLNSSATRGGHLFAQTNCRGINVMLSFKTQLPFDKLDVWRDLRAKPLAEQKKLLRDPLIRERLVQAARHGHYGSATGAEARAPDWESLCVFDKPLPPYETVADVAARRGKDPVAVMIELALETDFEQFFMQLLGRADPADFLQVMRHPRAVMTFSDTGAHVSQLNDCTIQTHLLAYWARERGDFTLEEAVRMVTSAPARAWGFADRGVIREGMMADLNVFDYQRLMPGMPTVAHDLPGGARRLVSRSEGMLATIVGGEVLISRGEHTGTLPGRLLRGPLARSCW